MSSVRLILIGALLFLSASCSATRIVDTWKASNFSGPPMRKVLVCAVHPEETTRRIFEDIFVQELKARGVDGVACYSQLAGNTKPTEQDLRAIVDRTGVDGMILMRLAKVSERTTVSPSYVGVSPFFYSGPFYPAYFSSVGFAYSPGYYSTDTIVQLLTQVYENRNNNELVWSGTSQTTDPDSAKDLVKSAIPKFLDTMAKAGVLPEKEKEKK